VETQTERGGDRGAVVLTDDASASALLALTLECSRCHGSAATIAIPTPPPLAIPAPLEFTARAIVRFLSQKVPGLQSLVDRATRGEYRTVVAELHAMAQEGGLVVLCENCLDA